MGLSGRWRRKDDNSMYHFFKSVDEKDEELELAEKSLCGRPYPESGNTMRHPRFDHQKCYSCDKMRRGIPGNAQRWSPE